MALENPEHQPTSEHERIAQLEEEIKKLREENAELKEKAMKALFDPLTNTLNRRGLKEAAEAVFSKQNEVSGEKRGTEKPVTALVLDIDNFKIINDAFREGHKGGDRILQEAANFLKRSIRGNDIVARTGGEEFVIIFNNATPQDIYNKFFDKEKGRARLGFTTTLDGGEVPINFSGGLSMVESGETIHDLDSVIDRADKALYEAKDEKNTTEESMDDRDKLVIYTKKEQQ